MIPDRLYKSYFLISKSFCFANKFSFYWPLHTCLSLSNESSEQKPYLWHKEDKCTWWMPCVLRACALCCLCLSVFVLKIPLALVQTAGVHFFLFKGDHRVLLLSLTSGSTSEGCRGRGRSWILMALNYQSKHK